MLTSSTSKDLQDLFKSQLDIDLSLKILEIESNKHISGRQALASTEYVNNGFTSISHSTKFAIAVSTPRNKDLFGIGIDIEDPRDLNINASKMFLAKAEISQLQDTSSENLLRLWTIKEAVFKSMPENNNLFLRDFEIVSEHENKGQVRCQKRINFDFCYFSTKWNNSTITIAKCLDKI